MFFSVNHDRFRQVNQELVRFVLNKETKYLSPRYRFFAYYNTTGRLRSIPAAGLGNVYTGEISLLSEITFPPFGYVMTLDSEPPDERFFEMTHFARYDYGQQVMMPLGLPVLPTHTAVPGDYRSKEQIYQEADVQLNDENGNAYR